MEVFVLRSVDQNGTWHTEDIYKSHKKAKKRRLKLYNKYDIESEIERYFLK